MNQPTELAVETRQAFLHRNSVGVLLSVCGVILLLLLPSTHGVSRFALSDYFAAVQLPEFSIPALPVVLACAVLCLLAAAGYFFAPLLSGGANPRMRRLLLIAAVVGGFAVLTGFLVWGAAGRELPFRLSNQLAGTLIFATPLIFGALCGVLGERAGVVNVSIEGQFLTAAFFAAVVGSLTRSPYVAIAGAVIAGVAMAALLALFAINYQVNQIVLGVVLNALAVGLTGFLFDQWISRDSTALNSAPLLTSVEIPLLSQIPFLGPILFRQNLLTYLAFGAVVAVWVMLFKTRWGLRVRAVGEHPEAADTVGISVVRIRWSAVLAGGVLGGLGGAVFTLVTTGAFSKDFTVGTGFIALAALIMGRWHPVGAMIMALFFGFVTQLGAQMQELQTPVPSQFLLMLPYVATIIAVAGLVGRIQAPAADGIPFTKS